METWPTFGPSVSVSFGTIPVTGLVFWGQRPFCPLLVQLVAQCHPALYLDFVVSQVGESVTLRKNEGQQPLQQQAGIFVGCMPGTQRACI